MQILFLSRWFPYPTNNGSKLRIFNLLRGLSEEHAVTLISFADEPGVNPDVPEVRKVCEHVHLVRWKPFQPKSWSARKNYLRLTPRSVIDTYSPEMARCIEECLASNDFDLVIASQLATASYIEYFASMPSIFEEVELGVLLGQYKQATAGLDKMRHGLTWQKHFRYVSHLLSRFRACTVASSQEHSLVGAMAPHLANTEIIPNCVDLEAYVDVEAVCQPNSLIFTGPFGYFANHDAMVWFLSEIYPRIQVQLPDVQLTITGDHAELPLPPATNLTLTGFVEDVRPLIAGSECSLVPLRHGGGTRLKILEAMALGTPVVCTSKGAEGLEAKHGIHLLIADTPEEFAWAVIRILREPELRRSLSGNGLRLVRSNYDWAGVMPRFLDLVDQTAYRQQSA